MCECREHGKEWKLARIADKDAQASAVLGIPQKPIVPSLPPKKRGRPREQGQAARKKKGEAAGRGLKDPAERPSFRV